MWQDRVQVFIELLVHHIQSEISVVLHPLNRHLLELIDDRLVDQSSWGRLLHLVLYIEVQNLQQVTKVVMLLVHDRILRQAHLRVDVLSE